jgi:hypothetical protein
LLLLNSSTGAQHATPHRRPSHPRRRRIPDGDPR